MLNKDAKPSEIIADLTNKLSDEYKLDRLKLQFKIAHWMIDNNVEIKISS